MTDQKMRGSNVTKIGTLTTVGVGERVMAARNQLQPESFINPQETSS